MNIDFLTTSDRVAQFLTENLKTKIAVLNSVLNKDDSKTALSTRNEHPEWFQGLETNNMSKVSSQISKLRIHTISTGCFKLEKNACMMCYTHIEIHILYICLK